MSLKAVARQSLAAGGDGPLERTSFNYAMADEAHL